MRRDIGALLLAALVPMLAACGAQPAAPRAAASSSGAAAGAPASLGMEKEPIGADYLWVPKSANTGKSPQLQAAGTEYGVVIAVPPGYRAPGVGAAPTPAWTVYLAHPTAGGQNLLSAAARVTSLPKAVHELTILGVTGPYAVFSAVDQAGGTLDLVTLSGPHAGSVQAIGPVATSFGAAVAIRGMVYWLGPGGRVHALDVASGQRSATQSAGMSGSLVWSPSGLLVGSARVQLAAAQPLAAPALPQGFQLVSTAPSQPPVAAVPQGYRVQEIPGGSSRGVSATDPNDPSVQVTIYVNACAGCYNPGFMAQGVNTLSTPIYVGSHAGTRALGDHGYVSQIAQKNGLVAYMLVADYLQGGDLEASVTVPQAKRTLAQEILKTIRLPW